LEKAPLMLWHLTAFLAESLSLEKSQAAWILQGCLLKARFR
jgi:hypothetical protein